MANSEGPTKWWLYLSQYLEPLNKRCFCAMKTRVIKEFKGFDVTWSDMLLHSIRFSAQYPNLNFQFHHGTILGKHSNHFRTPRTSKSWRYPSPSNSHQQDYYIFGKRILGIHNHQDDMNETSQKTGIMVPKKTFISDKRLHPALPSRPCHKRKLIFQPYWWKKSQTNP